MEAGGVVFAECYLNEAIARILADMEPLRGMRLRHCVGVIRCVEGVEEALGVRRRAWRPLPRRRAGESWELHAVLAVLDLEVDSDKRIPVERLVRELDCNTIACGVVRVHVCEHRGKLVVLVLFEGGPEAAAERLGERIDSQLARRLKSGEVVEKVGRGCSSADAVCRIVNLLAGRVRDCLNKALTAGAR